MLVFWRAVVTCCVIPNTAHIWRKSGADRDCGMRSVQEAKNEAFSMSHYETKGARKQAEVYRYWRKLAEIGGGAKLTP